MLLGFLYFIKATLSFAASYLKGLSLFTSATHKSLA